MNVARIFSTGSLLLPAVVTPMSGCAGSGEKKARSLNKAGAPTFFRYFSRLPAWKGRPPKFYAHPYSLSRIIAPAGQFHADVYLSPCCRRALAGLIFRFIVKHAGAAELLPVAPAELPIPLTRCRAEFKQLCRELLARALEKAKAAAEVQIDYLAHTALVKFLLLTLRSSFEELAAQLNNAIWEKESASRPDLRELTQLKEKAAAIRQDRKKISYAAAREVLQSLAEVQERDLDKLRRRYFGQAAMLPPEFFSHPLLYQGSRLEDGADDLVMVEEYVLLGRRAEDPNTYQEVLALLVELLTGIEIEAFKDGEPGEGLPETGQEMEAAGPQSSPSPEQAEARRRQCDGWLKQVETIDTLFNCFETEEQGRALQAHPGRDKGVLRELRKKAAEQEKFLNYAYRKFERKGLIRYLAASLETAKIYSQYCPPLVPQQVLQYLVNPRVRQDVESRLLRLEKICGRPLPAKALRRAARLIGNLKPLPGKHYLLDFLRRFAGYHRDAGNFAQLRAAMNQVNLVVDEKAVRLARPGGRLHEFLLAHEEVLAPVAQTGGGPATGRHAVIKAELRGTARLITLLREKGFAPATYFTLHLFDPVSALAAEYRAEKLTSGPGAIAMAILGGGEGPAGFTMARACGLAVSLHIVLARCNAENLKNGLPRLELGIGIGYAATPPDFLLDDERQVMISPALMAADQLAGCDPAPRRSPRPAGGQQPFNFHAYQGDRGGQGDERSLLCCNVNGIGLAPAGFMRLAEEIELEPFEPDLPECREEGARLYAGRFPVAAGRCQHLIIREAQVSVVEPASPRPTGAAAQKYYEVVTYPMLYGLRQKRRQR